MIDTYMDTKQFTENSYKMHVTDFIGGGGRIWTFDLRIMSPTPYVPNVKI